MTPKEKAKELVYKMIVDFIDWTYCIPIDKKGDSTIQSEAKKRALTAVDYIISSNPHSNPFNTSVTSTMDYWQEVKEEINRL